MDPKVAYWTGAWLNMGVIVGLTALGVRFARRGDYARHRRYMLGAVALVGAFLVSYGLKIVILGREHLELWDRTYVHVLRFHETCIAVLLLAGGYGLTVALRRGMPITSDTGPDREATHRRHRRAGWTAIAGAVVGALSATWVLWGMYARLP